MVYSAPSQCEGSCSFGGRRILTVDSTMVQMNSASTDQTLYADGLPVVCWLTYSSPRSHKGRASQFWPLKKRAVVPRSTYKPSNHPQRGTFVRIRSPKQTHKPVRDDAGQGAALRRFSPPALLVLSSSAAQPRQLNPASFKIHHIHKRGSLNPSFVNIGDGSKYPYSLPI